MEWSPLPFEDGTASEDVVEYAAALLLENTCQALVAQRLIHHRPPPTLQEWLDTYTFLFQAYPQRLCREGRMLGPCSLRAEIRPAARCRKQDSLPASVVVGRMRPLVHQDVLVLSLLLPTLCKVAAIYRTAYKRLPRAREVLAIVSIVLMRGTCGDITEGTAMRLWIKPPSPLAFWSRMRYQLQSAFTRLSGKSAETLPVEDAKPKVQALALSPERIQALRKQASVSACIAEEGFFVQHEADKHAIWAHTIGLSQGGAHADVLMAGLEPHRTEALLRRLAERVLAGEHFAEGQIIFDLTGDALPVCFVAVEQELIPLYARHAQRYYASEHIPLLQCVLSDRNGKFPWQHEEGYFGYQPLLCNPIGLPFSPSGESTSP